MKTMKISLIVILCICILILTLSNGCSAIGYFIGSTLDSPSYTITAPKYQVQEIEIGREITVYLKNSTSKSGEFFGLQVSYPDSMSNRPLKSILLQEEEHKIYININDVEEIYVSSAGEQKYIGLGIGAVIDITFFILFVSAMENFEK